MEARLPRSRGLDTDALRATQLSVVAIAFLAVAARHRDKWWYRARFVIPGSAAIAATGLSWTVQRAFGF